MASRRILKELKDLQKDPPTSCSAGDSCAVSFMCYCRMRRPVEASGTIHQWPTKLLRNLSAIPSTVTQITYLSRKATKEHLYEFFSHCGVIEAVEIIINDGYHHIGYVTFRDAYSLDTALLLNGAKIIDSHVYIYPWNAYADGDDLMNGSFWQHENEGTPTDLRWSDDELTTLLKNETEHPKLMKQGDPEAQVAVKWMMRVVAHYGFAPVTGILAADYFDRFTSEFDKHHHPCIVEKLWTLQLTAVACLSLAAKVEETEAPLPLDLQVEEAKFMFEPKTIQRMELLLLSTLHWRMHPVTPFSFIDHIIRRLELKPSSQIEFLDHINF